MPKTAILTTTYPVDNLIAEDFFISLKNQTNQDFDLIIVNDGFSELEFFIKKYKSLRIRVLPFSGSTAKNRENGIKYCLDKGYEYIIFCDFDDYFSKNRVENSLSFLKKYKIVVNEIIPFNHETKIEDEGYISKRMCNLETFSPEFLFDKNICGMSNTAVKTDIICDFSLPDDIIGIDWYFFSMIMLKSNIKGIFTNESATYYRQYENNTLGIGALPNKSKLKKLASSKKNHYSHLYYKFGILKQEFNNFSELSSEIEDEKKLEEYREFIRENNSKNPFWWENIIFKGKV